MFAIIPGTWVAGAVAPTMLTQLLDLLLFPAMFIEQQEDSSLRHALACPTFATSTPTTRMTLYAKSG